MGIIESWAGIVAAHTYVVGAATCAVVGAASAVGKYLFDLSDT